MMTMGRWTNFAGPAQQHLNSAVDGCPWSVLPASLIEVLLCWIRGSTLMMTRGTMKTTATMGAVQLTE